jgi:hypothetical protein
MTGNENIEYNLPTDAYVNFDAVSLKNFIIQRLNENPKFTDQNYEGSNLSSLIDIIAFSYHVLLFYLNQTSTESQFSQASIYENMNRIVNLVGYKPTGKQTSIASVKCVADSSLPVDSYYLRKYSYFLVDNIQYTINNDFFFEKQTTDDEEIDSIGDNLILYQGTIGEYPIYEAEGVDFETIPVVIESTGTRFISHGGISVYVKEQASGRWYEYQEAENLFLSTQSSRVYDLRLNENSHYEVKFGNDVFGKRLKAGDEVAIYYILSDGERGIISKNAINGNKLFNFNSNRFTQIYTDVNADNTSSNIDLTNNSLLTFSNELKSTPIGEAETVDDMRKNVPLAVSSQLRLVTLQDYESFISKNLASVVNSVKVVDNKRYMEEYIQYFYDICVDPNKVNRVLVNQVNFADSCDFNNVNLFVVPFFSITEDGDYPNFLTDALKNLIIDTIGDKKMIGHEIVPRDPVYIAFDIGFADNTNDLPTIQQSKLVITRDTNNKISRERIRNSVQTTIKNFFDTTKIKIGDRLDLTQLNSSILAIEGVDNIKTVNTITGDTYNGISFVSWNPVFEASDISIVDQNIALPYFKYPYFANPQALTNKIEISD